MQDKGQVSNVEYAIVGLVVIAIILAGYSIVSIGGVSSDVSNLSDDVNSLSGDVSDLSDQVSNISAQGQQPQGEEEEEEEEGQGGNPTIVEMIHWWTAGGEKNALEASIDVAENMYNIRIVENPIAQGGGGAATAQVKQRIAAGNPPETCQMMYGAGSTYSWVTNDRLMDVSDVITDGWKNNVPDSVKKNGQVKGKQYLFSMNTHCYNNLWYNKDIVKEVGIDMPLESFDEFYSAMEDVKEAGYTPLAFGAAANVWYTQLFCSILSREDKEFFDKLMYGGSIDVANNDAITSALEDYAKLFKNGMVNSDYSSLSWDEGGDLMFNGKAAFNTMGDWQNGHFLANLGWGPDKVKNKKLEDYPYGRQWFPGAQTILQHGDGFGVLKGAKNVEAAKKWLKAMQTAKAQREFCVRKGATPPRSDVTTDVFGAIQTGIIEDFRGDMSVSGSPGAGPDGMRAGLANALSYLAANPDDVSKAQDMLDTEYNKLTFPE